ncbi:hypothetical protein CF394_09600 [Tetzosporium hominis]|uniref:Fibronectin type-III domain-containing protein n=2 Tax=Tetzosporium hominis TaxID=2020506 RepID=A0A264W2J6_9BACL|nr:hypothetical protein CF394_09600 [Tetzosporium hominis]
MVLALLFSSLPWQQMQSVDAHGTHDPEQKKTEDKGKKPEKISTEDAMLHNVEKVEEIEELRTENEATFKNSNMTYTSEIYTSPIHYKENGKLKPIKNKLVENKDADKDLFGYTSTENKFTVKFAKKIKNKEAISINFGKDKLGFTLENATSDGVIKKEESAVTYENIMKDVDLRYTLQPTGVKEDLILKAANTPNEFLFSISGTLTAKQDGQTISFTNKKNEELWVMTPPYMEDAAGAFSADLEYQLIEGKNNKQAIKLIIDKEYLEDPKRVFPIVVDPTVTLGGSLANTIDTYVMKGHPNVNYYNSPELRTGFTNSTNTTRSFMDFTDSLPNLNGGLLISSNLKMYKTDNGFDPINTNVYANRVTSAWSSGSLTWNAQPGIDTTKTYGSTAANTTADGWMTMNLTSLVDQWYDGTPNYGVVLRSTSEGTLGTYRKFNSSDATSYKPYLEVTYSGLPAAPTGTAYGNGTGTGAGYVNLSWAPLAGATGYKVLVFNGKTYEEIDVGNTTSWTTKGKKLWPTAAQVNSGVYTLRTDGTGGEFSDDPRPVYQKSGGTYGDRTNYWFRVKAYNAYGTTSQSAAFMPTIPDQTLPTKPGKPSVTNSHNTNFTVSWSSSTDSNTGVAKYLVYMGTAAGKTDVANGVEVTTTSYKHPTALNPRTPYYVYVKAVDGAGNVSAISDTATGTPRMALDASLVSSSIPSPMEADGTYNVQFTVKNEGLETWTADKNILFGAVAENERFTKDTRLALATADSIGTGQTKTFTVSFNAGKSLGTFPTNWRMLKVGNGWFGDTLAKNVLVQDTTPPKGNILINNGQTFTNSPNVELDLNATDNADGAIQQKLQNETSAFSPYEAYSQKKSWTLSSGNGDKRVSVVYKDATGNESTPATATIKLDTSYPTASLLKPSPLEYVQGTVSITGTASDEDLHSYTVRYGAGSAPTEFISIFTGDMDVQKAELATWDTKEVPTGLYTLQLAVTDLAGNTTYSSRNIWIDQPDGRLGLEGFWGSQGITSGFGESHVNYSNGNLVLRLIDASLDGRGLDPTIERTYNAQDKSVNLLGKGWRLSFESQVIESANGDILLTEGDGSKHLFVKKQDGTYQHPAGVYKKVTKNATGEILIQELDDSGISETFGVSGKLLTVADKNNNKLTYQYTGDKLTSLKDDVGRSISLTYNTDENLATIQLYTGNKIVYSYTNKLLTKVEYLNGSGAVYRTLIYDYDSTGKLKQYTDPNGNPINYFYNGERLVQVHSKHTPRNAQSGELGTPVTVVENFNYSLDRREITYSISGENSTQEILATVNASGNLTKLLEDVKGFAVTKSFVYENNKLIESVDEKGRKRTFTYDALGNITSETDPTFTTAIDKLTITPKKMYEYKPNTSLLSKEIDALGRQTLYEYDDRGNQTKVTDSDGFSVHSVYDAYGNLLTTTNERGPLYGHLANYSFEEGTSTALASWKTTGSWSENLTTKYSGKRAITMQGTSSLESEYIPIKKGRLPVRGLVWVKAEAAAGTGVTGVLHFYDAQKNKISSKVSTPITGTKDWMILNVSSDVPTSAAYVSWNITAQLSSGSVIVDQAWLEEANAKQTFSYSSNGLQLLTEVDPYGNAMTYEYDAVGNRKASINALGQRAEFKYDADRKLIEEIDRLGKKTINEYDSNGNLRSVTNPLGQKTEYAYDESNRNTLIVYPKVTKVDYEGQYAQPEEFVTKKEVFQYNMLGQQVAEKDGNGNITNNKYDSLGRLMETTDPLKNKRISYYDANSNKTHDEDWAYDTITNTLYKKGTTYYNYDEINQLVSYTDASGNPANIIQTTEYDALGNEKKTLSGTGVTTDYRYDKNNETMYMKESADTPVEIWTLIDGGGHLAVTLDALGTTTEVHDTNGQLLSVIDAEGKKITYTYNVVGDKTKSEDATGTVTDWEYDQEGQLKKETTTSKNQSGETILTVTQYTYDDLGQVIGKLTTSTEANKPAQTQEVAFKYDELGRLVKETGIVDGKKTETRMYYDENDNVLKSWIYDETIVVPVQYDPDGDGFFDSMTLNQYDANNRLIKESISHTGTETINQFNDKEETETLTNFLGDTVVSYDANERVKEITTPNFDSYKYEYLVDDSISKVIAPGVTTALTFSGESKIKTLKATNKSNSVILDLSYQYSATEQITQITQGTKIKKYTYTPIGNLETVESGGKKYKYTYDGNSNVIKVDNLTTQKTKETYTYTTGNRLLEQKMFNETTGVLFSTTKFDYNAVGALSKKTTTEGSNTTVINYGYNNDDQLITLKKTVNGKVVEDLLYEYDQDGNRLSKTKLLEHSHFHYHRDTNGEIFSITKETGGVPESVSNFYRDADGNLLSMRYNEIVYYYQFNARGDVIALTDSAGTVAATYDYDEWGNVTSMTGNQALANANPYRFVGKYGVHYDQDANLYLMGWRDYDPSIGRFIVQDEYEGEEDEPTSLNRYLYADADPVNNIDPDGHAPKWMQKGWKSTKKYAKKGYNFALGDDIQTLRSPKSKWYHKAGAAASIASNFIPGAAPAKLAFKVGKGVKVKKLKKFNAPSVKNSRTIKVKAKQIKKVKANKKSHIIVPKKKKEKMAPKSSVELKRPYIRKAVRQEVERRALKTPSGQFIDPNTRKPIEGKYDLGHKYGHEFWREKRKAQEKGLTQKQFNDLMNNPDLYQIEDPRSNRSHKFEKKRSK